MYPCSRALGVDHTKNRILFAMGGFWYLPDTSNNGVGETTSAVLKATIVDVADINETLNGEGPSS